MPSSEGIGESLSKDGRTAVADCESSNKRRYAVVDFAGHPDRPNELASTRLSFGLFFGPHLSCKGIKVTTMNLLTLAALGPAVCLLMMIFVRAERCNSRASSMRRLVTLTVSCQLVVALAATIGGFVVGYRGGDVAAGWSLIDVASPLVYLDSLACVMFLLVSFVSWIVCHYSVRYLDGDENQGKDVKWSAVTVGAVSLLVLSGNLLVFTAAWNATSVGLHHLLVHFHDRAGAQRAAWTKFAVSRVGDGLLIAAVVLIYGEYGTLQFKELFAAGITGSTSSLAIASWCLILAAVTKSAQFPVHTWLPETMETPTPVSALMHAGIVNAGGYLVIRLSPLIVGTPSALAVLALIGVVTLAFGSIVMLTQTSVKRSLAYSTIAQMGFMMMQCGLGAFSAALLHLVAHSLYKAYAFLSSGSVLSESEGTRVAARSAGFVPLPLVLAFAAYAMASVSFAAYLFQTNWWSKPGGVVLYLVLGIALTAWLCTTLKFSSIRTILVGLGIVPVLASLDVGGVVFVDLLLTSPTMTSSTLHAFVATDIVLVFCGLVTVQWLISTKAGRSWLAPLYVHASNGFYVDVLMRRLNQRVAIFRV